MVCVVLPEKVPDGGTAVMTVDQPKTVSAAACTTKHGVHCNADLIRVFSVEIGGHDAALRNGFHKDVFLLRKEVLSVLMDGFVVSIQEVGAF